MPDKRGRQTPQEQRFVAAFARSGDRVYAAEKAGYSQPDAAAAKLLARPAVTEAVAVQMGGLRERNALAALDLLHKVITGDSFPAGVRVNAARAALQDYSRAVEGTSDDKAPADMTGAEIRRRIDQLQAEAAERKRPLLDLVAEEQPSTTEADLCE